MRAKERAWTRSRVVVEIDISRSRGYDMFKYRCLLWAAATGRLDGVIGAPPAGSEADSQLLLKQHDFF